MHHQTDAEKNRHNQVAVGGYLAGDVLHEYLKDRWAAERSNPLSHNVRYTHTKYMLIDPLSDDPLTISGSANFSESSTSGNDENMLVIRGDTRVADVYLGEFMRLFTAFRLRAYVNAAPNELVPVAGLAKEHAVAEKKYLKDDASWAAAAYVSGSPAEKERLLFSGA